jgi:hypothetical protein
MGYLTRAMFHYQEQIDATNTIQTKAAREIHWMWEEGGHMLGRRGFDRRPDRPNQQSDRTSSSQDRSAHPTRNSFLRLWGLRPSTWERGQTSSNESSTEVEQRPQQQEQRELFKREKLPLDKKSI